jgi:hypothetical protein
MGRIPSGLSLALVLSSCGSDDSESSQSPSGAVVVFQSSACKKDETNAQALSTADPHAGLKCIRWQPLDGGKLRFELTNFEGACGAKWAGKAIAGDAGLELWATNPSCLLAACGWCIYDWTFDVAAPAVANLPFSIVTDPCPGEQEPERVTATLPLSTSPEGELCRYAHHGALSWQAAALGSCGQVGMPCLGGSDMCSVGASAEPCDTGLTCADGAAGLEVCHTPCTADCGSSGILTCQEGLCRPANPW